MNNDHEPLSLSELDYDDWKLIGVSSVVGVIISALYLGFIWTDFVPHLFTQKIPLSEITLLALFIFGVVWILAK